MAAAPRLWDSFPIDIRSDRTISDFKQKLKTFLIYLARHFVGAIILYLHFLSFLANCFNCK